MYSNKNGAGYKTVLPREYAESCPSPAEIEVRQDLNTRRMRFNIEM
jgi:hypothetical protein